MLSNTKLFYRTSQVLVQYACEYRISAGYRKQYTQTKLGNPSILFKLIWNLYRIPVSDSQLFEASNQCYCCQTLHWSYWLILHICTHIYITSHHRSSGVVNVAYWHFRVKHSFGGNLFCNVSLSSHLKVHCEYQGIVSEMRPVESVVTLLSPSGHGNSRCKPWEKCHKVGTVNI